MTKYEHACLLIEDERGQVLIDPGKYTKLADDLANVKTVVITHEHADHLDVANLNHILDRNPGAELFSTEEVSSALAKDSIVVQAVKGRTQINSQGFQLNFNEVDHSIVYGTSPCRNLSIGIDDFLYYPGDSFVGADQPYRVLALPTSGPWFNLIEAIDLAKSFDAKHIVGTHDIFLNQLGHDSFYNWLTRHAGDNREIIRMNPGDCRDFA